MGQERTDTSFRGWMLSIFFLLLALSIAFLISHQQLKKLQAESLELTYKSRLVAAIHDELISISRSHYQVLHASSYSEADDLLSVLNQHINNYLVQMHELENIATIEDQETLSELKNSFDDWYKLNREVQGYAGMIASTRFISILNRLSLTLSQIENSEEGTLLLISQTDSSNNEDRNLSN